MRRKSPRNYAVLAASSSPCKALAALLLRGRARSQRRGRVASFMENMATPVKGWAKTSSAVATEAIVAGAGSRSEGFGRSRPRALTEALAAVGSRKSRLRGHDGHAEDRHRGDRGRSARLKHAVRLVGTALRCRNCCCRRERSRHCNQLAYRQAGNRPRRPRTVRIRITAREKQTPLTGACKDLKGQSTRTFSALDLPVLRSWPTS